MLNQAASVRLNWEIAAIRGKTKIEFNAHWEISKEAAALGKE